MNIRKNIDYSEMFKALDKLMAQQLPQMELYCAIGEAVCQRTEKGAAVMATEYLHMFREGIEKVSLNESVLSLIADQHKREYFQNSMYRLVLHTESHSEEAVQGAAETSFYSHISRAEKQRTTRDILCFMYSVNKVHVLAHIPKAKNDILTWMASI